MLDPFNICCVYLCQSWVPHTAAYSKTGLICLMQMNFNSLSLAPLLFNLLKIHILVMPFFVKYLVSIPFKIIDHFHFKKLEFINNDR